MGFVCAFFAYMFIQVLLSTKIQLEKINFFTANKHIKVQSSPQITVVSSLSLLHRKSQIYDNFLLLKLDSAHSSYLYVSWKNNNSSFSDYIQFLLQSALTS
jgi:hypothetical protein